MLHIWLQFLSQMNIHTLGDAELLLWGMAFMGDGIKNKKKKKPELHYDSKGPMKVNKIGHLKENYTSTGSKRKKTIWGVIEAKVHM